MPPPIPPAPPSLKQEIAILRRLIRRTCRHIHQGTITPATGVRLITQAATALSTLLQTHHHLNPPHDTLQQARQELDRIFRAMPDTPNPQDQQ